MSSQKIIIDTDLGDDVDDILAIAFGLLRRELNVLAITTVTNCSSTRSRLVAQLLATMDRREVPFAPGMNMPLRRLTAYDLESLQDLSGYKLNQSAFVKVGQNLPEAEEDAMGLMARMVREHPGEVTLVAIGPLTNVAVFLRRHPELAKDLKSIAIMGGEVELNRTEHNIAWDPQAAEMVFTSGVPLFVGTWNVTRQFFLTMEDCNRIKALGTPLGEALGECIDLWWPYKAHKPGPVMYDLAPILWSYAPEYFTTQDMAIGIETKGDHTFGRTVAISGEPNAHVSKAMRAEEVKQLYMETILGV